MKHKYFLLLAIVALLGFIAFNYGGVWAQEQEQKREQTGPLPLGSKIIGQPSVEYSTAPIDVDQAGVADPQQVLYTEPTIPNFGAGIPRNTTDFNHPSFPTTELDALANPNDFAFQALLRNKADLLISFQGDPPGGNTAVWREAPNGATAVLWTHANLDVAGTTFQSGRELDALEVWGPLGPGNSDDAFQFSLVGDPGGFSVFNYNPVTLAITGFVTQALIQGAVQSLGYSGPTVDLDGLMVNELDGTIGVWDPGDTIIFSIRAAGNWDGGEIVVLGYPGPAGAYFLNHGLHPWNTAFNAQGAFPGVNTEEVDAIEAYVNPAQQVNTPTLTQWGLIILIGLLIASAVFIMLRRRRAAVLA